MIDLIVYACLIVAPADCQRTVTTIEGDVISCILSLMPATAEHYKRNRTRWEVQYMRCRHHRLEA